MDRVEYRKNYYKTRKAANYRYKCNHCNRMGLKTKYHSNTCPKIKILKDAGAYDALTAFTEYIPMLIIEPILKEEEQKPDDIESLLSDSEIYERSNSSDSEDEIPELEIADNTDSDTDNNSDSDTDEEGIENGLDNVSRLMIK